MKCSRVQNVKNKSAVVRFVVNTMTDFSHKQLVNSSMQFVTIWPAWHMLSRSAGREYT